MASCGEEKVDPVTGLSQREIDIIQSTWAILAKDIVASGLDVMLSLLDAHPDYQSMFKSFKDVPRAELVTNKMFQAHGVNVVKALDYTIQNLNDTSILVPHLQGLGSRHENRGLKLQSFHKMTIVMIGVLRRNVGNEFTKEVEDTWRKTMTGAWTIMFSHLES